MGLRLNVNGMNPDFDIDNYAALLWFIRDELNFAKAACALPALHVRLETAAPPGFTKSGVGSGLELRPNTKTRRNVCAGSMALREVTE